MHHSTAAQRTMQTLLSQRDAYAEIVTAAQCAEARRGLVVLIERILDAGLELPLLAELVLGTHIDQRVVLELDLIGWILEGLAVVLSCQRSGERKGPLVADLRIGSAAGAPRQTLVEVGRAACSIAGIELGVVGTEAQLRQR